MPIEPMLGKRDISAWQDWTCLCLLHATSRTHARRASQARTVVRQMREAAPSAYVAWSGGKDSTALACLCAEEGITVAMAQHDDYDYPGKVCYIQNVAARIGIEVDLLRSEVPAEALRESLAGDDIHSRASSFSEPFYRAVDGYAADRGYPGVYLGLRKDESYGRKMNRLKRGPLYQVGAEWRCCPLVDWEAIDVFAFLLSRGIDVMPVYKCCADINPGLLRMAWWIPGSSASLGQGAWLRQYWPSLYRKWVELQPTGSAYA